MTNLLTGTSGICVVTDYGASSYPAWQPSRKISISKSVGGNTATMLAGIPPSEAVSPALNSSQVASFVWQNVQFCSAPNSGTGWGTEIYIANSTAETSRHDYNAVESGKLGDTPPLDSKPNLLAQGYLDSTGENMIRIVKPAFWLGPAQQTVPGFPALNLREVSEMIMQMTYRWGLAGNNNIIRLDLQVTIPTDPIIQSKTQLSLVPFYHYNPNYNVAGYTAKPFTTQEWVALANGATRSYTSGDTSTTEVVMNSSADGNFAMATVYGDNTLGSGFYKGLDGTGTFPYVNAYGFVVQTYAGGIPPGLVQVPIAICFGSRADLIGASGAIATAAANLPKATYP